MGLKGAVTLRIPVDPSDPRLTPTATVIELQDTIKY
jgi:hypothetical protein